MMKKIHELKDLNVEIEVLDRAALIELKGGDVCDKQEDATAGDSGHGSADVCACRCNED